jgi:hypothetical protein
MASAMKFFRFYPAISVHQDAIFKPRQTHSASSHSDCSLSAFGIANQESKSNAKPLKTVGKTLFSSNNNSVEINLIFAY